MAMRRAWAWVSRVILLGTPALYGRVRTALDFHTCRRCSTTAIGQTVLLTDTGAQIALMPTDEGPQSSHTVLAFEVEYLTDEIEELDGRGVGFLDYDLPTSRPPTTWL